MLTSFDVLGIGFYCQVMKPFEPHIFVELILTISSWRERHLFLEMNPQLFAKNILLLVRTLNIINAYDTLIWKCKILCAICFPPVICHSDILLFGCCYISRSSFRPEITMCILNCLLPYYLLLWNRIIVIMYNYWILLLLCQNP